MIDSVTVKRNFDESAIFLILIKDGKTYVYTEPVYKVRLFQQGMPGRWENYFDIPGYGEIEYLNYRVEDFLSRLIINEPDKFHVYDGKVTKKRIKEGLM